MKRRRDFKEKGNLEAKENMKERIKYNQNKKKPTLVNNNENDMKIVNFLCGSNSCKCLFIIAKYMILCLQIFI